MSHCETAKNVLERNIMKFYNNAFLFQQSRSDKVCITYLLCCCTFSKSEIKQYENISVVENFASFKSPMLYQIIMLILKRLVKECMIFSSIREKASVQFSSFSGVVASVFFILKVSFGM